MSQSNENPKKPTHTVYAVKENVSDKSSWTEIGASWPHKDGLGFSAILNLVPFDGKIVLRANVTKQEA